MQQRGYNDKISGRIMTTEIKKLSSHAKSNQATVDIRHNPWRQDFPVLLNNPGLVFLDTGASAQKPEVVIEAINHYYRYDHANVHRGLYDLSERTTRQFETIREKVAEFLNAHEAREIVFTKGTTEAINLVASAFSE